MDQMLLSLNISFRVLSVCLSVSVCVSCFGFDFVNKSGFSNITISTKNIVDIINTFHIIKAKNRQCSYGGGGGGGGGGRRETLSRLNKVNKMIFFIYIYVKEEERVHTGRKKKK